MEFQAKRSKGGDDRRGDDRRFVLSVAPAPAKAPWWPDAANEGMAESDSFSWAQKRQLGLVNKPMYAAFGKQLLRKLGHLHHEGKVEAFVCPFLFKRPQPNITPTKEMKDAKYKITILDRQTQKKATKAITCRKWFETPVIANDESRVIQRLVTQIKQHDAAYKNFRKLYKIAQVKRWQGLDMDKNEEQQYRDMFKEGMELEKKLDITDYNTHSVNFYSWLSRQWIINGETPGIVDVSNHQINVWRWGLKFEADNTTPKKLGPSYDAVLLDYVPLNPTKKTAHVFEPSYDSPDKQSVPFSDVGSTGKYRILPEHWYPPFRDYELWSTHYRDADMMLDGYAMDET